MIKTSINEHPVFQFENLACFPEIKHFSTTREGGLSTGKFTSFNLGLHSGENSSEVLENRNKLCHFLEISPDQLIFPNQTHSSNIKFIGKNFLNLSEKAKREFLKETDALITGIKEVVIAVKTADCVPVLLFDQKKKIVAAIHAGWRGTLGNITLYTVKKMIGEFGTDPLDIIAGIGPSISPAVYEVGKEVWEQFNPEFYYSNGKDPNKRFLDLWKANIHQLRGSGIPENNIEIANLCTFSNPCVFYSARRDGVATGRMATGIMLMK